jgi:hypothetical protein
VASGAALKLSLLWRAQLDAPQAAQAELRLVRESGEVVQRTPLPLLGGRFSLAQLKMGSVVRDEQTLVVGSRVPGNEMLAVEIGLLDQSGKPLSSGPKRLGMLRVTGREHHLEPVPADQTAEATFGEAMQLVSHQLDQAPVKAGSTLHVTLHWRGLADMQAAYKVFVHVLDPSATQVVGQRDAEPQDGAAPTTSWLVGEVLDDAYAIPLPASLTPGEYPIEVGVYEPRSGKRLLLPNGESRVLLSSRLQVR